MVAEPLCLSKDAVFLMKYSVMVITFSTVEATWSQGRTRGLPRWGGKSHTIVAKHNHPMQSPPDFFIFLSL
jgi:hypothetical protein